MLTTRAVGVPGVLEELERFARLVEQLTPTEMAVVTRCEGWSVGDVARHFIGSAVDLAAGRFDDFGAPWVIRREIDERQHMGSAQLAEELREARIAGAAILDLVDEDAWRGQGPANNDDTLGHGIEGIWTDSYLHSLDIDAALGRPELAGPGLEVSIHYVAEMLTRNGWPPMDLELDGLATIRVSGGGERTAMGEPVQFLLAATQRVPDTLGLPSTVTVW